MPQAGGPQFFSVKKCVKHLATRNMVLVFKQNANLFKQPLLAGDIRIQKNMIGLQ